MAKKPWKKHAAHWRSPAQWPRTSAGVLSWVTVVCKSMGFDGGDLRQANVEAARHAATAAKRHPSAACPCRAKCYESLTVSMDTAKKVMHGSCSKFLTSIRADSHWRSEMSTISIPDKEPLKPSSIRRLDTPEKRRCRVLPRPWAISSM